MLRWKPVEAPPHPMRATPTGNRAETPVHHKLCNRELGGSPSNGRELGLAPADIRADQAPTRPIAQRAGH